ncbi:MAG: UDP-N-acetylglucosamine 1-carboxyvinyltransferase [Elusimicrobia bacterium GWA2_56_46]|nr:MAG: UDP-N-acetylglucosamine 1-carboxyvinyltransferase [Elusimicrobia bacterium GWA2_56_46]OGR54851.1 MAG: UDP-N-acetylglucosamine 1-carboxyvinyltransferase [Elusimicrobia bacterium GWC2_56_31]HBB67117.1 UDP-N-acetylglucosamine 1-carboxyvinyltransferase [Elusimicrobiota bacterium]HBW23357.1 UDP-N-acetylglucosamine 1-carboxyvinyltransferase [Elusimicrobiota bacterium]
MDNFVIQGGGKLAGEIRVSGSKNSALPILAATMLTGEKSEISNVPDLMDIRSTLSLLNYMGKTCSFGSNNFTVRETSVLKHHAPYELVRKMRASMLVAGPLLARFKKVRFSLPGGCSIGVRPIDIHLEAFKKLGAEVFYEKGDVILTAAKLRPARLRFRFPSVGATENLMMCASLVKGSTVLENCAREPEIADLARALRKMGAFVEGEGTSIIKISGAEELKGLKYEVMPDRIETGTFMLVAAAAGGTLKLSDTDIALVEPLARALKKAGVEIVSGKNTILVNSSGGRPRPVNVATKPHPGFPTDLQAPWMAFMARVDGKCEVHEAIFENRFMHAAELMRMGAEIMVTDRKAVIKGVERLLGAPVMASDIRAGAALIVAAAAAKGETVIRRVYHIDRGYEKIEAKLRRAGLRIERVKA